MRNPLTRLVNALTEKTVKNSELYRELESERDILIDIRERRRRTIITPLIKRIRDTQGMYFTMMDLLRRYGTLDIKGYDESPKEINIFSQEVMDDMVEATGKLEKILRDKNGMIAQERFNIRQVKKELTELRELYGQRVPSEYLAFILEAIPRGVIILDQDMGIVEANSHSDEYLPTQLTQPNFGELFADSKELTRYTSKLRNKKVFDMDVELKHKRKSIELKTKTAPIIYQGERIGYLVLMEDKTGESRLNEIFRQFGKLFGLKNNDLGLDISLPEAT